MPLSPQRRTQLDNIVLKMASQNAPKADVQMVVNDFVSKFGNEAALPEAQPAVPAALPVAQPVTLPPVKPGMARQAASAVGNFFVGAAKGVVDAPREFAALGSDLGAKFGQTGVGQKIGQGVRSVLGGAIDPETARTLQAGLQGGTEQTNFTKPQNTAQKVGFGAEKIGLRFR